MFVVFSVYEYQPLFQHDSEEFCKELVKLHNNTDISDKDISKMFPKNDLLKSTKKSISEKESVIASLKSLIKLNVNIPSNQSTLHKMRNELKDLNRQLHELNYEYDSFKKSSIKSFSKNPDMNKVLKILSDEGEIYYDVIKTFEDYCNSNSYKL